jgi:hypothetical protein
LVEAKFQQKGRKSGLAVRVVAGRNAATLGKARRESVAWAGASFATREVEAGEREESSFT